MSLKPKTVFGRTFLVLLVSGLAMQGGMFGVILNLSPRPRPTGEFRHNLEKYIHYLASEIAKDPSLERAHQVLVGTGFDARASGAVTWRTDDEHARRRPPGERRRLASFPFGDGKIELEDGRPFWNVNVETPRGPVRLTILGIDGPVMDDPRIHLAFFVVILAVVFLVASLALRRILGPLGTLGAAFEQMKLGRTEVSVPAGSDDELGRLSRGFNDMAAGIRFLIKDKEQLFTELSHEFRAPIARASAANALVEDPELRGAIQADLVELDGLIHALLTAARLEAGNPAPPDPVDLTAIASDVLGLFPQARGRLILEPVTGPLVCRGDARSLRTLARNLVENGLKYSPSDRKVRLAVGRESGRPFFSVTDEGIGISAADVARIFEPFYRGDDERKTAKPGFGLGLALCRRIARAHGGDLRVESVPGRGTTVTALFPPALA